MPQDSLRSVVYRSLVTCNDPNGVVEYGTMRKSKTELRKKEKKTEQPDLIESSLHKDVLPPFEILEVSKGAQRLNRMIDLWSKGNESKDIARDLLKGALDLQESLVMLCNLQESSKHFGQMQKEHDHRYKGGILDGADVGRIHSDRFADRHGISRTQPARVSLDGSAELKKVIRESLARQNLLSTASDQEEDDGYFTRLGKKLDVFSDIPSTSSSQSSTAHSNNSTSMDWSVSSASKEMKAKTPNVIAKLMGLEEFPSQTSPPRIKQVDSKKTVVHRRLVTDIEMPNVRNAYPISRNNDPRRKTLKEVIDTMHLKGLLKDNDVEGLALRSRNPWYSLPEKNNETPTIVLIKPLPSLRKEKISLHGYTKREEVSSSEMSSQGGGESETEEIHHKVEARRDLLTSTSRKLKSVSAKAEPNEKPIKRSIQHEGNSNSIERRRKQEVGEQNIRGKASANTVQLGSAPLTRKPEEKGGSNKKHEEVKKVASNRKIPEDKNNEKHVTMLRSSAQDAATSVKCRKHYMSQVTTRDHIQRQESTARRPIPVRSRQSKADISPGQAKNNATRTTKPVKESVKTIQVSKRPRSKQQNAESNQTDSTTSVSTVISRDHEDNRPTVIDDTEPTKTQIEDHGEEEGNSGSEVGPVCSQQGSRTESTEEPTELPDHQVRNKINLKELLRSNSSFLRRAEDLFELHMNQATPFQATFSEDVDMIDTRLALDCANELVECKSRRTSPAGHSLFWIHTVNPRTSISLDQLLGEVCRDFDEVNNYSNAANDIHKLVECDIKCRGRPTGGAWELAWEDGFSVKEADQVLGEVEKQVLSELIEEIIVDYAGAVVQHVQYL